MSLGEQFRVWGLRFLEQSRHCWSLDTEFRVYGFGVLESGNQPRAERQAFGFRVWVGGQGIGGHGVGVIGAKVFLEVSFTALANLEDDDLYYVGEPGRLRDPFRASFHLNLKYQ